jgi:hypothetical protein
VLNLDICVLDFCPPGDFQNLCQAKIKGTHNGLRAHFPDPLKARILVKGGTAGGVGPWTELLPMDIIRHPLSA